MLSFLKSLPVQLVLSILLAFLLAGTLPCSIISLFYTASTCFIDLLLFVLPFMVFSLIFLAVSRAQGKSLQLLILVFAGVFLSNFLALFTAYFFSSLTLPAIWPSCEVFSTCTSSIAPLIQLHLPIPLSTDKAMLLAVICG